MCINEGKDHTAKSDIYYDAAHLILKKSKEINFTYQKQYYGWQKIVQYYNLYWQA